MTTSSISCYVLGCREHPALSVRHKRFGVVATCESHDPHRQGYGLALLPEVALAPASPPPPPAPTGGQRVALKPRPKNPLTGGALPTPEQVQQRLAAARAAVAQHPDAF